METARHALRLTVLPVYTPVGNPYKAYPVSDFPPDVLKATRGTAGVKNNQTSPGANLRRNLPSEPCGSTAQKNARMDAPV